MKGKRAIFTTSLILLANLFVLRAADRPNILFVFTDDQRYDAMSVVQAEQGEAGRYPWLKTPGMDRLAAEGVRFRNAFVVNSLCSPSRAVNLSGRYNHLNGIASNFRDFPVNSVTYATLLQSAGYSTAYIGKWHMGSQKERPGFDYAASFLGHSRYHDPEFIVQGEKVPRKGWIDDISTDYAIEYLQQRRGSGKPWMMVVGFKTPHGPFEPPARARERYLDAEARVVPNFNVPAPYNTAASRENLAKQELAKTAKTNLGYFRCISAVDECVGRLMAAVDENGFRDNTVVIYTSDNGFYLGEHGLGDKRSAYEESLRVPFIVRYPALGEAARGRVCDRMVLNLDLARSILDLAGVKPSELMQGRSWKPLLTGDVADWRKAWFYEYFAEAQRGSRVPDIKGVRTETAKLVTYPGYPEWTEMFDLAADPFETKNLYDNPEYAALRAGLEKELAALSKEVGYVVPEYTDRPHWWGLPGGADWKPDAAPVLKLTIDPKGVRGKTVVSSVNGKDRAEIRGDVTVTESDRGSAAFRFGADGCIDAGKPAAIDPAMKAFTVEVVAKIEPGGSGVLAAAGGASLGYCLAVSNGHVLFAVRSGKESGPGKTPVLVRTKKPQEGWLKISGILSADREVELLIDGRSVGRKKISELLGRTPNEGMQIGADSGSLVIEPAIGNFTGLLESAGFYSGEKR